MVIEMDKILTFIVNEYNEILLLKGSENDPQFNKSFWYVVTGGCEECDSNREETVKREVKEETNLDIDELELFDAADDIQPDRHYITMHVIAKKHSGELKIMEPTKEDKWKWFDLDLSLIHI